MIKSGKVPSKKVISEEKGFDARTISADDINNYGLGD
jgi:simple sugar transport system substrate-binding protein